MLERMKFLTGLAALVALALTVSVSAREAATPGATASNFWQNPTGPFPSLVAAAQANHIPLEGIDPRTKSDTLEPGDSVTALMTQSLKGERTRQWLIYLKVVAPTASEQAAKPPDPMVLYTSFGNKLQFESAPAYVAMRVLGPFVEAGGRKKPPKVEDKSTRFSVNKGFLGLGLDRGAAVDYRIHHVKDVTLHGSFQMSGSPFNADQIARGRKLVEAYHITPDEERAWAGSIPALLSYFEILQETPGLSDVVFKVVELPSIWSLLRHGGISAGIDFRSERIEPARSAVCPVSSPAYFLPMGLAINNRPALEVTLLVTEPEPPLLACGGIVGLVAENPKEPHTYVALRVISARHGLTASLAQ